MIYTRLRGLIRHQISQNVLALYCLQAATFLVPLVTLPYVSRVLGPAGFGLVVFSQGASIFLTLFIDWGFTPIGIWKVAAERNDPEALATTVALVRTAQLLMSALSVPVAIGVLIVVQKFNQHPAFLVMAWVAAISAALMPNWFFVGIERVRLTATLQLAFRVAGAALTFVLVQKAGDAWIVMVLYMASSMGMWIASDVLVYRRVRFGLRGIREGFATIRQAFRVFVGTIGVSLLSTFNVVLLGLFVPSAQVAQFGGSERIVRTWQQLFGPLGTAVYPRLTFLQQSNRTERARQLWKIAIVVVVGAGVLVALLFEVFAPVWIRLIFGQKFVHEGVPILRILVLLIPSSIVSSFAVFWLVPLGRDRAVLNTALAAGLLNVTVGCILVPLIGPQGMAWSVVLAQLLAAAALLVAVYRIPERDKALFRRRGSPPQLRTIWHPGARGVASAEAALPAEAPTNAAAQ